ncbi:MAG: DNA polymerase III subunit epsilon [Paracoccus sp. (in: a-proteobacteria)]|nr:DNA polymerase III subunit epsilon [Paracoccus sp. (in: a-proteobacteria)]
MREIVLDTETTGISHQDGDRIVEIGAIELIGHMPTDNKFHEYINPERIVPDDAIRIHGLTNEFLADKPVFSQISKKFVDFIGTDSKLIIHNASFDMAFLNAELSRCGLPVIEQRRAVDTLAVARQKFPGAQNSLDALCRRFGIDNSNRVLHGALLDSELLAEVYLELIGGRQPGLAIDTPAPQPAARREAQDDPDLRPRARRPAPLPPRLTADERARHLEFIARLGENAIWRRYNLD